MDRYVEHAVIIQKDLSSAITYMNIPIKYDYPLFPKFLLCYSGCYCYIIEEAKSIDVGAMSMMARWSHYGEDGVEVAVRTSSSSLTFADNTRIFTLTSAECSYCLNSATG